MLCSVLHSDVKASKLGNIKISYKAFKLKILSFEIRSFPTFARSSKPLIFKKKIIECIFAHSILHIHKNAPRDSYPFYLNYKFNDITNDISTYLNEIRILKNIITNCKNSP